MTSFVNMSYGRRRRQPWPYNWRRKCNDRPIKNK